MPTIVYHKHCLWIPFGSNYKFNNWLELTMLKICLREQFVIFQSFLWRSWSKTFHCYPVRIWCTQRRSNFCTYNFFRKCLCTIPGQIYEDVTLYSTWKVIFWKHSDEEASISFPLHTFNWQIFKSNFCEFFKSEILVRVPISKWPVLINCIQMHN